MKAMSRRGLDHFTGCLLGGAVGDALGWPVEFLSWSAICRQYGHAGICDLPAPALFTDDTQMTLFTAEAILQWRERHYTTGDDDFLTVVHHAYLRWLRTQEERAAHEGFDEITKADANGWLLGVPELRVRRAPGNTCLSALRSGQMGTITAPLNQSKGCGGVMRVAPVGLFWRNPVEAFERGCQCAAVTHGHPSGYLSAGCLATVIAGILSGADLAEAVSMALAILQTKPGHEECLSSLRRAIALAQRTVPTPQMLERIGEGWTGEEALAIAVYCALTAEDDFVRGVTLAVNHSGDSDSTGTITGNILGAFLGKAAIPTVWLDRLELRDVIEQIAADLFAAQS